MIKLIVSDLDGTLLPEGTAEISPEFPETVRELKKKGIMFIAASGRQYESMRRVFEPVQNEILFIAENGGLVIEQGKELYIHGFEQKVLDEIIDYSRLFPKRFSFVSVSDNGYTDSKDDRLVESLRQNYLMKMEQVDDMKSITRPVLKVAMYCEEDAAIAAEEAKKVFGSRISIMASGDHWVDFMPLGVDKGAALSALQEKLNIEKSETMAFGDNHNDIGMLQQAGESYAVSGARDAVKQSAKYVVWNQNHDGVLGVIRTLL